MGMHENPRERMRMAVRTEWVGAPPPTFQGAVTAC